MIISAVDDYISNYFIYIIYLQLLFIYDSNDTKEERMDAGNATLYMPLFQTGKKTDRLFEIQMSLSIMGDLLRVPSKPFHTIML